MSLAVWFWVAAHAVAQTPTLTGRVVRADNPAVPLAGARVSLVDDASGDPALTDARGRFTLAITATAPADALRITKAGFLSRTVAVAALATSPELALVRGAVIAGVVQDAAGAPATGVTVRLTRLDTAGGEAWETSADDRGAYRFAGLRNGRYQVSASSAVRDVTVDGKPVAASLVASDVVTLDVHAGDELFAALTDKETARTGVPGARGVIEGAVRDEAGELAEGVTVRLFRGQLVDGRRQLQQVGAARVTDDRGRYRMFGLAPGQYVVQVTYDKAPEDGALSARVPIYFPSASAAADAVPVRVGPDVENAGVDIAYRRERYARVHGSVIATGDAQPAGSIKLMRPFTAGALVEPPLTSSVEANGSFVFERVVPGDYVLFVPRPTERLPFRITVAAPDTGPLTIRTTSTRHASGRILLEGDRSVTPQQFSMRLLPADPDVSGGLTTGLAELVSIGTDWRLTLQPLDAPSRFVLQKAPPGWFIKSVNVSTPQPANEPQDNAAKPQKRAALLGGFPKR